MDQASDYLTWSDPDGSVAVRMSRAAMARMNIEIMRGFGVTRRRGTEQGGVLLGYFEREPKPFLVVEDFESVPCEYAFGPSYVLSSGDHDRFAEATRRVPANGAHQVVGWFRSHTRDGLTIDEADVQISQQYFSLTDYVLLVVKPFATRSAAASFFFPKNGSVAAGEAPMEFTFAPNAEDVTAETALPVQELPVQTQTVELSPVPVQPDEKLVYDVPGFTRSPEIFERHGPSSLWVFLLSLSALAFGFVLGYQMAGGRLTFRPLGLHAPEQQSFRDLGLRAETVNDRVRVHWPADSASALAATSGSLTLEDSGVPETMALTPAEMRGGTLLYKPRGASVRFRLELSLPGNRSASETVVWSEVR